MRRSPGGRVKARLAGAPSRLHLRIPLLVYAAGTVRGPFTALFRARAFIPAVSHIPQIRPVICDLC